MRKFHSTRCLQEEHFNTSASAKARHMKKWGTESMASVVIKVGSRNIQDVFNLLVCVRPPKILYCACCHGAPGGESIAVECMAPFKKAHTLSAKHATGAHVVGIAVSDLRPGGFFKTLVRGGCRDPTTPLSLLRGIGFSGVLPLAEEPYRHQFCCIIFLIRIYRL